MLCYTYTAHQWENLRLPPSIGIYLCLEDGRPGFHPRTPIYKQADKDDCVEGYIIT